MLQEALLRIDPHASRQRDPEGYLPMHMQCQTGGLSAFLRVYRAHPEAIHALALNGETDRQTDRHLSAVIVYVDGVVVDGLCDTML